MTRITERQYEFARTRIEELLPIVTDDMPADDKNVVELTVMSDIVEEYEKEHYPMSKPTIGELIELSLEDKGLTQRDLAERIGISPSRISAFVSGRAVPTLKIAKELCVNLNISPAQMLGL